MSNKYLNYSGLSYFWQLIKSYFNTKQVGDLEICVGSLPPGWLECDGSELLIEDYSELYSVIGDTFGAASDEDYFKLPDFKGRVLVGLDPEDEDFSFIGQSGGERTHLLTAAESGLPTFTWTDHYFAATNFTYATTYANSGSDYYSPTATPTVASKAITVPARDAGVAHNNMQPSCTVKYIIFTGVFSNE